MCTQGTLKLSASIVKITRAAMGTSVAEYPNIIIGES